VDWYLDEYLPLGLTDSPLFHLPPPMPVQSDSQAITWPAARAR